MVVERTTSAFHTIQGMKSTQMAVSTPGTCTVLNMKWVSTAVTLFKRNLHDHEAPCVVCFVKSRGSMLMMPARNDCPSGWTMEYKGYLMTAHHNHGHPTDFICVDGDPEYVPGSHANKDGALLYPVEGVCGSLPCLPYVNGRELTCAVCTKWWEDTFHSGMATMLMSYENQIIIVKSVYTFNLT